MLFKTTVRLAGLLLVLGLLAVPAAALAAPALTISPTSGPPGTTVNLRATGLDADTSYLIQLVSGTGNVNTVRVFETTGTSNANGELTGSLTAQQAAGTYTVRIVTRGGTVVATAPFTITSGGGAGLPGLPRTGGGGMALGVDLLWLLAGLGCVACGVLTARVVLRRLG